jgi:hypothetical protein
MNSNELQRLPDDHQKLIEIIAALPEFSPLLLWTSEQAEYLKGVRCRWQWIGTRIDYLQRQQLGFINPDPADRLSDPKLQKYLIIYSNYFFQMLQVVIAGFEGVQTACERKTIGFDFNNPRELFAAMCEEFSKVELERATSQEVNVGATITELRQGQSLVGKFYRGSLSKHEAEAFCQEMQDSGLSGFVLASIYQCFRAYLNKPATPMGFAWKNFKDSQREVNQYLKSGEVATIRWNCGYPVWSSGDRPVRFPDS